MPPAAFKPDIILSVSFIYEKFDGIVIALLPFYRINASKDLQRRLSNHYLSFDYFSVDREQLNATILLRLLKVLDFKRFFIHYGVS